MERDFELINALFDQNTNHFPLIGVERWPCHARVGCGDTLVAHFLQTYIHLARRPTNICPATSTYVQALVEVISWFKFFTIAPKPLARLPTRLRGWKKVLSPGCFQYIGLVQYISLVIDFFWA